MQHQHRKYRYFPLSLPNPDSHGPYTKQKDSFDAIDDKIHQEKMTPEFSVLNLELPPLYVVITLMGSQTYQQVYIQYY